MLGRFFLPVHPHPFVHIAYTRYTAYNTAMNDESTTQESEFGDAQQAVHDVAAGVAVLLDVRRDDEWDDIRAEGATHWPLARLQADEMPELAPDTRIYVHCAAGKRAEEAKDILSAHGFIDVINIGGLSHWQEAGGEVE